MIIATNYERVSHLGTGIAINSVKHFENIKMGHDIYALIKRIIPTKDNFKQVQQEMKFSSNVSEVHDRQLEIAAVTIIIC